MVSKPTRERDYMRWIMYIILGLFATGIEATLIQQDKDKVTHASTESTEQLYSGVNSGDIETVRKHLSHDNVNTYREDNGLTLLHLAVSTGHVNIIELLLQYGADVHARSLRGETPLHYIAQTIPCISDIIHMLLDHDSDINAQDHQGKTLLHIATGEGWIDLLYTLLEAGADCNIRDHHNHLPADHATPNCEFILNVALPAITGDVTDLQQLNWRNINDSKKTIYARIAIGRGYIDNAYHIMQRIGQRNMDKLIRHTCMQSTPIGNCAQQTQMLVADTINTMPYEDRIDTMVNAAAIHICHNKRHLHCARFSELENKVNVDQESIVAEVARRLQEDPGCSPCAVAYILQYHHATAKMYCDTASGDNLLHKVFRNISQVSNPHNIMRKLTLSQSLENLKQITQHLHSKGACARNNAGYTPAQLLTLSYRENRLNCEDYHALYDNTFMSEHHKHVMQNKLYHIYHNGMHTDIDIHTV